MPKRRKVGEDGGDEITPKKSKRLIEEENGAVDETPAATPSNRKSILKRTPGKPNGVQSHESTPNSIRRILFATPLNHEAPSETEVKESPIAARNDRSARKKSQRTIDRVNDADSSDEGADDHEEAIAQAVLEEDEEDNDIEDEVAVQQSATPTKTGRPRGRPKGRRRERTPSPPPDMPPHELYFFQNRAGANKTSSNVFSSQLLLDRDDYLAQSQAYVDPHRADIDRLGLLHTRAFDQWVFELQEGFNLCLYGYGSKRNLAMDFVEHLYTHEDTPPKIIVTNGYAPGLTIRDILACLSGAILPKSVKPPGQPVPLLEYLLGFLAESPPGSPLVLVVHSLDHPNLRKPATQSLLARLAAHAQVQLVATCDTPNFPLLWDLSLTRQFRFAFHDATTFEAWPAAALDVIEEVDVLLGRSRRRLAGKDGVGYVLKSLPENARHLFRILVAEQLALGDVDLPPPRDGEDDDSDDPAGIIGAEDDELAAAAAQHTPSRRGRGRPKKVVKPPKPAPPAAATGVEYRTLYHKAVEEFVCSSELNFRTLLKEFYDHQMVESRKDVAGTERLLVPFRKEELEAILEELV